MTGLTIRHHVRKKNMSNPVGRPRKIDSPETFDALVDTYILICQDPDNPKAITLTGMVLALGLCSKDTFYEYEKFPEFTDSVKRARLLVEHEYENRLVAGNNAAAPIFALKNFGWKDKHEVEQSTHHSGGIVNKIELIALDDSSTG